MDDSQKELLSILLAEKTTEEIEELQKQIIIGRVANYMHTILCIQKHKEGAKSCDFYIEEQCTRPSESKKEWHRRAALMLSAAGAHSYDDVDLIMKRLPKIISDLVEQPTLISFLMRLLPPLLERATASRAALPEETSSFQCGPSSSGESQSE